ncbi:MAG: FkbM family methyltransferase [Thermoleophilaceae bacterium]|nr:FkbM family methyltransferase [Thermoleophilaceae bacterium]
MRPLARLRTAMNRARLKRLERRMAGPALLRAFAAAHPDAVFVEIGSNDGEQHDHLRPHILATRWRGVMVEPVPYVFERLRGNYGHLDRVALENAAVAAQDGELPFFHLAEAAPEEREQLPEWYDALGSFSRELLLQHGGAIPAIEERIVETRVPTLTFGSLCAKHELGHVDLVLVDTEGHDWEVVRSIDLERRPPAVLVFEHYHLSAEDRAAARAHLEAGGYDVMEEGFDTFCLHADAAPELRALWSGLTPAVAGVYSP